MAKSPRYWAAVAVILTWGLALGWLALRRTGQSDLSLIASQASLRLAPGEAWFRVMAGEVQIGYAGITLDTLANGRYRIREQVSLELPGETALIRTIRSTEYFLGAGLGVDSLISRMVRPGRRDEFRASELDGGWDVRISGLADTVAGRMELDANPQGVSVAPVPLRVVPLRLALVGALATGDVRTLAVAAGWPPSAWSTSMSTVGDSTVVFADSSEMDPDRGEWIPVTWDTVPTRALIVETPDGPVRMVLDFRGSVISIEHPFGVRWIREEFSVARFNFRNVLGSLEPLIREQLPVLRWQVDTAPADSQFGEDVTWEVRRRNGEHIHGPLLMALAGGRQSTGGGRLESTHAAVFSHRNGRGGLADALIQTDDSLTVALADSLVDPLSRRDYRAVAAAIRRRVTTDTTMSAPVDAAGALRTGRARPEGIARLFAAILQRRDFAVRVAVGVRPADDTLYTLAWLEVVQRGDRSWETLDPRTGRRLGLDWIRIGFAGSAAPEDLLPLVADVRFTPVTAPATEGVTP